MIELSPKYLKKASMKVIDKTYAAYEDRRIEKANVVLTDIWSYPGSLTFLVV